MKNHPLIALTLLVSIGLAAGCAQIPQTREYINPRTAADQGATPLSSAVRVGDTLYLSGALGLNSNRQVPDDPAEETRNIMNSIQRNVEAAGMTMDDIVYVQIFCSGRVALSGVQRRLSNVLYARVPSAGVSRFG